MAPNGENPETDNATSRNQEAKNVSSSIAGASSGDFHAYRHQRRRELDRIELLEKEAEQKKKEEDQQRAETERHSKEEIKTQRRAKKRRRKIDRRRKRKKARTNREDSNTNGIHSTAITSNLQTSTSTEPGPNAQKLSPDKEVLRTELTETSDTQVK